MAINIKNYVDISTTFPSANVAGRSFGGLVFTASPCIQPAESTGLVEAYEILMGINQPIGVAALTLDEVGILFGEDSQEYEFAEGYYNYISPSGRFASRLAFSRVGSGESPKQAFTRVNSATNLFGSFTFLSLPDGGSTSSSEDEIQELLDVAKMNTQLDAKYLFVINKPFTGDGELVTYGPANAIEDCQKFAGTAGTCFVYGASPVSAYMPMAILGSTDYTNGQVVNFMFKQFITEEPIVFDDDTYSKFNRAYVNFCGQTQTNGQTLNFYQRGFNTDGVDTSVYCNEVWFKSICETSLMNLLSSRERLPADALGVDLVKLEVIDCCSAATSNGMFMQKEPTAQDMRSVRELIASTGGDETDVGSVEADVATKGYSVYAFLTDMEDDQKLGRGSEKVIKYYVFYGTADSVRYIKGNDILLK